MALSPSFKILIDVAADVIWVLDTTGVYSVNNPGGWGDPNAERNEKALMIYAKRLDSVDKVSEIITDQFVWDNGLSNSDVSEFQITLDKDGVYVITLLVLKVSTDGTNDLEGNVLTDGDYVLYNDILYLRVLGSLEQVAPDNYSDLIENADIPQFTCEDIVIPNILITYNKEYKKYRDKRNEGCEDINDDRDKLIDLRLDIEGSEFAFRSNLKIQARKNIEALHNEYD